MSRAKLHTTLRLLSNKSMYLRWRWSSKALLRSIHPSELSNSVSLSSSLTNLSWSCRNWKHNSLADPSNLLHCFNSWARWIFIQGQWVSKVLKIYDNSLAMPFFPAFSYTDTLRQAKPVSFVPFLKRHLTDPCGRLSTVSNVIRHACCSSTPSTSGAIGLLLMRTSTRVYVE